MNLKQPEHKYLQFLLSNLFYNKCWKTWWSTVIKTGFALSVLKHFWSFCFMTFIRYLKNRSTYSRVMKLDQVFRSLLLFVICCVINILSLIFPVCISVSFIQSVMESQTVTMWLLLVDLFNPQWDQSDVPFLVIQTLQSAL